MDKDPHEAHPAGRQRLPGGDDLDAELAVADVSGSWSPERRAQVAALTVRQPATATPAAPAVQRQPEPVRALPTTATERQTADDDRAAVLAQLQGQDVRSPAALAAMRQRLDAVPDPTSPEGLDELRRHLPLLEGLMLSLMDDSRAARKPEDRVRLARAALQAKQGYDRAFALLRAMGLQKAGQVGVIVHDGD